MRDPERKVNFNNMKRVWWKMALDFLYFPIFVACRKIKNNLVQRF
jgi:hypothetical protein